MMLHLVSFLIIYKLRSYKMVKMIDNYTLNEEIGQGNYGKVFRAKHLKKPGEFAVKIIPLEKFHQNNKLEECTIN